MQEVEIALAEEAFQRDKAQLAEVWAQRTHQFQQAVDLQVPSPHLSSSTLPMVGHWQLYMLAWAFASACNTTLHDVHFITKYSPDSCWSSCGWNC